MDSKEKLEKLGRLASMLEKDTFAGLSSSEQDKILDEFLKVLKDYENGEYDTDPFSIYSEHGNPIKTLHKLINAIGEDEFKKVIKEGILSGSFSLEQIPISEVKKIGEKVRNGTATEKEIALFESITEKARLASLKNNDPKDIENTGYKYLEGFVDVYEKNRSNKHFVKDLEPLIDLTFSSVLAALMSDERTSIGKLFNKRGISKLSYVIGDITQKLSEIIISYAQENNISPDEIVIALLHMVKLISGPVDISLTEFKAGTLEEVIKSVMIIFCSNDPDRDPNEAFKKEFESDEDEQETPPNGGKNGNTNTDVRKLLLDED